MATGLAATGHTVSIAVMGLSDARGAVSGPLSLSVAVGAKRAWPSWLRERGELWDGRRLARLAVDQHGPFDLIWERHALFTDAGARLARQLGVPRLLELNAPQTEERGRFGRVRDPVRAERVERAALHSASRVLAVSSWLADWAQSQGVPAARVRHLPNGSAVQVVDRAAARHTLRVDGLVLAFVGSLKPWHGLHRLPALLDALPEATGLVAGVGPTALPPHPRLRALGHLDGPDLDTLLAAADVGLAPYAADAPPWFCPLKLHDYRAAGLPFVSGPVGDAPALAGEGAGRLCATEDPNAWASAVREAAALPRVRRARPWTQVVSEALHDLPAQPG